MKKATFIKYLLFAGTILILYIILTPPAERTYKINLFQESKESILADDFNGELNKKYWNIVERGNNYNNELQYYNPGNVNVRNGFLEIEARKEEFDNHQYTSGLINTRNKFEFLYGKIIFRAKPAIGKGALSAVWLLPADESLLPEIDFIEALGSENNRTWTGIHYLDSDLNLKSNFVNYANNNDFSIYELDWDENEIRCYVNNKLTFKTNTNIPNKKMYLIINLSVGGDWTKNPDDNIFPTRFLLDYIIIIPKELDET